MRIYIIGDLHLSNDKTIEKPMDVFGLSWKDHDQRIREDRDAVVGDEDLVLVAGDISWGLKLEEAMADLEWIHARPGRKVLIKGNHDLWWSRITYLNSLYDDIIFLQNDCHVIEGEGIVITASRGWPYPGSDEYTEHDEKIYARELMRMQMGLDAAKAAAPDADIIACLHYPPAGPFGRETAFTRLLEEYGVKKCIYGHLHGKHRFRCGLQGVMNGIFYRLVSQDYLQGDPILLK